MATWKDMHPRGHSIPSIAELVDRNQELIVENEQLRLEAEALATKINAVEKLHTPMRTQGKLRCKACIAGYYPKTGDLVHTPWPCRTIKVLDGGGDNG